MEKEISNITVKELISTHSPMKRRETYIGKCLNEELLRRGSLLLTIVACVLLTAIELLLGKKTPHTIH